jgi:hypothetical protein
MRRVTPLGFVVSALLLVGCAKSQSSAGSGQVVVVGQETEPSRPPLAKTISPNLVTGGDMERNTDAWTTGESGTATFEETHAVSYEVIRGSEQTMKVLGSVEQVVNIEPTPEDARYFAFGAYLTRDVTASISFYDLANRELTSHSLKQTDRFTRSAISKELPPGAAKANIRFEYFGSPRAQLRAFGFVYGVVLFTDSKPVTLLAEPFLEAERLENPNKEPRAPFVYDIKAGVSIVGPDAGFPIAMQNLRNIKLVEIDGAPVLNGGENHVIPNLRREASGAVWTSTFRNPRGIMEAKFWVDEDVDGIADPDEDAVVTWMG